MARRRRACLYTVTAIMLLFAVVGNVPAAAAAEEDAGTYGAAFLRIPIGARIIASHDAVAGMDPDASLIFSNPAYLANMNNSQIFLTTSNWLDDLNLSALSLVTPIGGSGLKWSLGTRLLFSGGLQGLDNTGQMIEESNFYDLAITSGLSQRFGSLALGANVTYLRENLATSTGTGLTFSLGGSYYLGAHRIDAYALDMGGSLAFDGISYPIDSRVVLGYGYAMDRSWARFDLGAQLTIPRSDSRLLQLGAAYHLNQHFTLRTGLDHAFAAPVQSSMPLSAGLGVHYGSVTFDYAYTAQEYFPSTHTVSVAFAFGGDHRSEDPRLGATDPPAPTTPTQTATQSIPVPVEQTQPISPAVMSYALIAGIHGRVESARAEARALRLVKVPAITEQSGQAYRVVIGRYDTRAQADDAKAKYRGQGHVFKVVSVTE